MIKKLSLLVLCVIFSMFLFVSCEDEEEDTVDTENSSTQSDNDTTDSNTTDPTNQDDPTDPTGSNDPTDNPTDPTNPTDNPTDDPTDDPTDNPTDNPTDDPTDNPTDPTTNPGEGSDGNLNTGDTSGNQAQAGAVGAACTRDEDCTGAYSGSYGGSDYDQEAFCLTANDSYFPAPGGYCTFGCDSTDYQACSSAGGVYHGYNGWGDGYCFHKCTKPSDCRVGYRCSNKIHACLPDCAETGCTAGNCDETDKVCL